MLLALTLSATMASLLRACAPAVGIKTMAGIVQYESGWHPYAIGDNDTHRAYYPPSAEQAVVVATDLLRLGHNLDAGLGQVNSSNWAPYGIDVRSVFEPCTNVRVASRILSGTYGSAIRTNWIGRAIATNDDAYRQQQYALIHALSSYNSGRFWASMTYASNVYAIAREVVDSDREGLAAPRSLECESAAVPPPRVARVAAKRAVARPSGSRGVFKPAWPTGEPAVARLARRHIAAPRFSGSAS